MGTSPHLRPSSSQTIDADLPCVHCGYNLLGQDLDGRCPECGRYTRDTVERDDKALSKADDAWLDQLGKRTAWLIVGFFVDLFAAAIATAAWLFLPPIQTIDDIPGVFMALIIITSFNSLVIHFVGVTKLTSPEYGAAPGTKAADLARYLTPVAYGFALISICMIFAATYASIWLGLILHTASIVLINIVTPALLYHLRHLARRDNAQSLASQTSTVLWGMSYTLLIVSACHLSLIWRAVMSAPVVHAPDSVDRLCTMVRNGGLCVLAIFSIWWIILLFQYHGLFLDAKSVSRYITARNRQAMEQQAR